MCAVLSNEVVRKTSTFSRCEGMCSAGLSVNLVKCGWLDSLGGIVRIPEV